MTKKDLVNYIVSETPFDEYRSRIKLMRKTIAELEQIIDEIDEYHNGHNFDIR